MNSSLGSWCWNKKKGTHKRAFRDSVDKEFSACDWWESTKQATDFVLSQGPFMDSCPGMWELPASWWERWMSGAISWLGNGAKQERSATAFLPTLNLFWYSTLFTAPPLLKEQKAIMIFTLSAPVCTMVPGCLLLPRSFAWMGLTLRTAGTTDHLVTSINICLFTSFFQPPLFIFSSRLSLLKYYFCPDAIKISSKYDSHILKAEQPWDKQNEPKEYLLENKTKNSKPNTYSCNEWSMNGQFMHFGSTFPPCLCWLYG